MLLLVGAASALMVVGSATTNTCMQEGPHSPLAVISESGDTVTQSLSWWPLGRACEWKRADGHGTVITFSSTDASTAATYGAMAAGAALLIGAVRTGRARTRRTPSAPTA